LLSFSLHLSVGIFSLRPDSFLHPWVKPALSPYQTRD